MAINLSEQVHIPWESQEHTMKIAVLLTVALAFSYASAIKCIYFKHGSSLQTECKPELDTCVSYVTVLDTFKGCSTYDECQSMKKFAENIGTLTCCRTDLCNMY
ncbi:CD59 glycoprotein-like [Xenopus laevis]|uniref:CD59 glycoprotein-like n=1 Tax=Xenopus laevis TaxID=8355 RepID=A0A8J1LXK5_XENLA|nr:CD59 glycoprotein-like [Xenopus laevis]